MQFKEGQNPLYFSKKCAKSMLLSKELKNIYVKQFLCMHLYYTYPENFNASHFSTTISNSLMQVKNIAKNNLTFWPALLFYSQCLSLFTVLRKLFGIFLVCMTSELFWLLFSLRIPRKINSNF